MSNLPFQHIKATVQFLVVLVLKSERMQKRRLEAFLRSSNPLVDFSLPNTQPKFDMRGIEFTFSVNTGIQWKVALNIACPFLML